ncbi:MAG: helix-turn-helix domain-containing protein [Oscillospiraceae bacterium]|jgi:excisionase family DNA binding protein|nr:helix-turn-helix domain-containing protein [Oscillospiraceae bacterium]
MFNDYKDVVTVEELAEMLKIGRNTAYELVRANIIKSVRVGRSIRIAKAAVIAYLTECEDAVRLN